jgi:cation transport protein ChaC
VREYLDIREVNGYSIQFTPFHPAASTITTVSRDEKQSEIGDEFAGIRRESTASVAYESRGAIKCLVYIGLPENPQFLGPQDADGLARKILESTCIPLHH